MIITLLTLFKLLSPVTANVPVILAPVPVTTTTLAVPPTLKLILPFAVGIDPLLVPLLKPVAVTDVQLKLPEPLVVNT